jgi:hypothetical protein
LGGSECPDVGKGPFLVENENAFGLNFPMYTSDGSLSLYGWLFTVFGTWMGQILMIVSILWITDIPLKISRKISDLRRRIVEDTNPRAMSAPLLTA